MSNGKKYHSVPIPLNIDEAIELGGHKAISEKQQLKKLRTKKVSLTLIASLVALLTLGITNPALASKIPIVEAIFKKIEQNLYFSGNYSDYATTVNKMVTSNGVSVTLSEILCDGQGIYVTYMVQSEELFQYLKEDYNGEIYEVDYLIFDEEYTKVDFTSEAIETWRHQNIQGKFIDEYTFIGVQQYDLSSLEADIPDQFMFSNNIMLIQNSHYDQKGGENAVYGEWAFNVPVNVNKELRKEYDVSHITENGAAVTYISTTPFSTLIDIKLPNEFYNYYQISVFDESGTQLRYTRQVSEGNTIKGVYPKLSEQSQSVRVVIEKGKWSPFNETSQRHWQSEGVIFDQSILLN